MFMVRSVFYFRLTKDFRLSSTIKIGKSDMNRKLDELASDWHPSRVKYNTRRDVIIKCPSVVKSLLLSRWGDLNFQHTVLSKMTHRHYSVSIDPFWPHFGSIMKDKIQWKKVMVPMGVQIVSWGPRKGGRRVSGHDEPWKLNIHLQRSTSIFLNDTANILPPAQTQRLLRRNCYGAR